jgi:hypothetical protein
VEEEWRRRDDNRGFERDQGKLRFINRSDLRFQEIAISPANHDRVCSSECMDRLGARLQTRQWPQLYINTSSKDAKNGIGR